MIEKGKGGEGGKTKVAPILSKRFIGYGHYDLTITYPDGKITVTTGNVDLMNRLNSEDEEEKKRRKEKGGKKALLLFTKNDKLAN